MWPLFVSIVGGSARAAVFLCVDGKIPSADVLSGAQDALRTAVVPFTLHPAIVVRAAVAPCG